MASRQSSSVTQKRCFVTIGATASFNKLIKAVLTDDFITSLQQAGYVELRIQYGGPEGEAIFQSRGTELKETVLSDRFTITGFGYNKGGLREEMVAVKGQLGDEGMVISHAGQWSESIATNWSTMVDTISNYPI